MARGKSAGDQGTLEMALVGYQLEKAKIEERIREISALLKGRRIAPSLAAEEKAPVVKRVLSASARKRISAAQSKRWAEYHKRLAPDQQE